ncbi:hypothetical protein EDC04DRAFT_2943108 [Pisolithus marmoratus]|nr:hypothetical protein EDC04DRAFT_2943108 [Pisolithus marmoratus]
MTIRTPIADIALLFGPGWFSVEGSMTLFVLTNGDGVGCIDSQPGDGVWTWSSPDQGSLVVYSHIHDMPDTVYVIGFAKSKTAYTLHVTTLSIANGSTIGSFTPLAQESMPAARRHVFDGVELRPVETFPWYAEFHQSDMSGDGGGDEWNGDEQNGDEWNSDEQNSDKGNGDEGDAHVGDGLSSNGDSDRADDEVDADEDNDLSSNGDSAEDGNVEDGDEEDGNKDDEDEDADEEDGELGLVEIFPCGGDSGEEDANEDTDEDDISANGDCDEEDQDQDQEEQTSDEASDYRDGVEADEDDEQCSLRGPGGICVPPVGLTAIVPSTSTIACSLLGFVCIYDLHVDITGGSFPFTLTQPCPVLTGLGLEYTGWGFLCKMHSTLIHPRHLCHHIKKQPGHRPLNSPFPKSVQQKFLEHVLKSHGISSVDKEFALPELPLAPIPGLNPYLAFAWLFPGCSTFRRVSTTIPDKALWAHVYHSHGTQEAQRLKKSRTQLTTSYIVQPYWGSMAATEPGASATILFHSDFQPHNKPLPPFLVTTSGPLSQPVPSDQLASMAGPVSAEWLQELGWGKWLSEVQADPEVLLPLIALPVSLHQLSTWDGPRLKLEIAILTIHRLLRGYLMDANSYIQDKHGDLRAHIHAG